MWAGSEAGDILRPVSWGLVFVSVCGQATVLTAGSYVGSGSGQVGQGGRLTLLWRLPLLFIQPVKWHDEEHGRRDNNSAAGREDVEIQACAVDQDSCNKKNMFIYLILLTGLVLLPIEYTQ